MNPMNSELKCCPFCDGPTVPVLEGKYPTDMVRHEGQPHCPVGRYAITLEQWQQRTRKSEALAADAVERAAEDWMHKRFAPDHPNDCDYDADEMIDAFMAGAALSTLTPSPAVDLLREVEDAMAQALAKDDVRPLIGPYARLGAALKEAK